MIIDQLIIVKSNTLQHMNCLFIEALVFFVIRYHFKLSVCLLSELFDYRNMSSDFI